MEEYTILNGFTFGPALVKDGELLKTSKEYGYDPNGLTARTAFGQLDRLSYVMVIAEGVQKPERGVTHQQLANFMYSLGCRDAFNLDGGGSSAMYYPSAILFSATAPILPWRCTARRITPWPVRLI